MDAELGLTELPRAYRLVLTLRSLGADDRLIADCLDIDPSAVGPLFHIGQRKLARIRGSEDPAAIAEAKFSTEY